jgi:hypothetical protein
LRGEECRTGLLIRDCLSIGHRHKKLALPFGEPRRDSPPANQRCEVSEENTDTDADCNIESAHDQSPSFCFAVEGDAAPMLDPLVSVPENAEPAAAAAAREAASLPDIVALAMVGGVAAGGMMGGGGGDGGDGGEENRAVIPATSHQRETACRR